MSPSDKLKKYIILKNIAKVVFVAAASEFFINVIYWIFRAVESTRQGWQIDNNKYINFGKYSFYLTTLAYIAIFLLNNKLGLNKHKNDLVNNNVGNNSNNDDKFDKYSSKVMKTSAIIFILPFALIALLIVIIIILIILGLFGVKVDLGHTFF